MWIVLGVLLGLAAIITVILLLPVRVILKNDEDNQVTILYKILFKTFGEEPDPDNPVLKAVKQTAGLSKTDKDVFEHNVKESGLLLTVKDTCRVLLSLLQQVVVLLGQCTVKKFKLTIICTGEDAADAAISYGQCCAVAYPLIGFMNASMKVNKRGQDVRIDCDYRDRDSVFLFDVVLSIPVYRVLAAFIRIAYKEALNADEELINNMSQKSDHSA